MGSTLKPGTYQMRIEAGDDNNETFTTVQLIKNGQVRQIWYPHLTNPVIIDDMTSDGGDYYYVKVTQQDGDEAISSPIFFTGGGGSTASCRVARGQR
jgi:hypothetical protein